MKRYLIDSTLLTAALFNRPAAAEILTPLVRRREAATSVLVYGEIVEYLKGRSDLERRHAELRELLDEIKPYFLTFRVLERYADLRRQMRRGVGVIGDVDTLIAATALERHLTVMTTDTDFERVPELRVMLVPRERLRAR